MKGSYLAIFLSLFASSFIAQANEVPKGPLVHQSTAVSNNKIDLNKADLSSLVGSVKGIGKKRAEAIIAYRESHQGFKSIEELAEVKGLGQRFVIANREKLMEVFVVK